MCDAFVAFSGFDLGGEREGRTSFGREGGGGVGVRVEWVWR